MSKPSEVSQLREMTIATCALNARHCLRINRLMQHNANVHQQRMDWNDRMRMATTRAEIRAAASERSAKALLPSPTTNEE